MKKIEFKTHNENPNINCGDTSLVGEVDVTYAKLKKIFGQPTESDGYKSDAEWEIEFSDGKVATIYNYKDGKNYNGNKGLAKTKITNWHIGGRDLEVVARIKQILKENK